ncbi:MAG TPA: hypothetical protein VF074_07150 [Pyrinomonadaceae bacterium]
MKVCVKCNSQFPDTERFCELDGSPLVSSEDLAAIDRRGVASRPATGNRVLVAVALGGIIIGALLFLAYLAMTRQPENANVTNSNTSVAQQQIPSRPIQPAPETSESPTPEASPSPSVDVSPSPQPSATIQLSSNPISTARASGQSGPVIIRLNTGVTIEADEAWQTGEGIWYRKSSILTLLDPKDVKVIEKVPPPPQPTSTASPSP